MTTTLSLISKQTVGANGASSVTFSNIPQTYTDLKVVASARSTGTYGNGLDLGSVQFNSTSSGYSDIQLYGSGSSASSGTATYIPFHIDGSDATSSTFGNAEWYIPNYTSSNYKSVSSDKVTENNGTTAFALLNADLWSNTSAITSITFVKPTNGNYAQYSTFYLYGVSNSSTQNSSIPYANGGDIITTDGTYWYHAFLASGTFTPNKALSCDVLVVAGGGGGNGDIGGGGGAGGLQGISAQSFTSSTGYTITVGAGGAGTIRNSSYCTNGNNSSIGTLSITSTGGGYGAGDDNLDGGIAAHTGGSGGGGQANFSTGASGNTPSTSPSQGNSGGNAHAGSGGAGSGNPYSSGGGGGAGASGSSGTSSGSGNGGIGSSSYSSWGLTTSTGDNQSGTVYYAGGGGGGADYARLATSTSNGLGGYGGGGVGGGGSTTGSGSSGTSNTGGGGGGAANSGANGGNGGSGIVIVRYAI